MNKVDIRYLESRLPEELEGVVLFPGFPKSRTAWEPSKSGKPLGILCRLCEVFKCPLSQIVADAGI